MVSAMILEIEAPVLHSSGDTDGARRSLAAAWVD